MAGNRNFEVMEPLFICHGAEHGLKLAAVEGSPWINQGASVNPILGETSPISSEPEIGQYQPLLADGAEWKLICPAEGTDIDFNLQVQSEFTAVPYPLSFKLGDYRRKILSERDPISAPVVGDEVTAEIQVGSFYTDKVLEGVDVDWYFDGTLVRTKQTTDLGWSKFDHSVTEVGEHTITAKVYSPYDDTTSEHTFTLNAYLESPWEQATLLINGELVAWNSPGVFLFRGQPIDVKVEAPFLRGKEVALDLVNPDDLDIEASPDFEAWVPAPDAKASWALAANGTKSGRIKLRLLSKDVVQIWDIPCVVLSTDLAEEADVKIGDAAVPEEGNWFYRGKTQIVTLHPKLGSPLAGLPVMLSRKVITGLDLENVESDPEFNEYKTNYSWAVTGNTRSGTFQLSLAGKGMTAPITLTISKLISSNLSDEVTLLLNGVEIPSTGVDFVAGEPKKITLSYKNANLLVGVPLSLDWLPGRGLNEGDLVSQPPLREPSSTHEWDLIAEHQDGLFKLRLFSSEIESELVTGDNRLVAVIKVRYMFLIAGEWAQLPRPPAEVQTMAGVYVRTVRVTGPDNSPIEGAPVTFHSPIHSPTYTSTNSNGFAYASFLVIKGKWLLTAVTMVEEEEYTAELLLDVSPDSSD